MRAACSLLTVLAVCAWPTDSSSAAAPAVSFRAELTPKAPGKRTTASFALTVAATGGGLPPPVIAASIRYPAGLGLPLSGLGIEDCSLATLEALGMHGCPADSFMGEGEVEAAFAFGPELIEENAHVTLLRTGGDGDQVALLFFVVGKEPVWAEPVLTGVTAGASPPYGGRIDIGVPLIPTVPDAPDVSLVRMQLVIGPRGLTYYERVGSTIVSYHPHGLSLPERCPRGGYPFAIELRFLDGSSAGTTTTVPCPSPLRAPLRPHT